MKVRNAEPKDIPPLEAVINQHWKLNLDHPAELRNPNSILLVAEEVVREIPRIVGTALMWVTTWNKTGYLVELAVDREYQKRGIGSQIVDELSCLKVRIVLK